MYIFYTENSAREIIPCVLLYGTNWQRYNQQQHYYKSINKLWLYNVCYVMYIYVRNSRRAHMRAVWVAQCADIANMGKKPCLAEIHCCFVAGSFRCIVIWASAPIGRVYYFFAHIFDRICVSAKVHAEQKREREKSKKKLFIA